MGSSCSNLKNQVVNYYLFHKQIECFFINKYNDFYRQENEVKIEDFYVISIDLIKKWKNCSNYLIYKQSFDALYNTNNTSQLKSLLEKKFDEIYKEEEIGKYEEEFKDDLTAGSSWCCRSIIMYAFI